MCVKLEIRFSDLFMKRCNICLKTFLNCSKKKVWLCFGKDGVAEGVTFVFYMCI